MDITSKAQLQQVMKEQVIKPLLVELSKKTAEIMKQAIAKDVKYQTSNGIKRFSLEHIADAVTYSLSADGGESTIYIDYNYAQYAYGYPATFDGKKLVAWSRFRNTFSGGGGRQGSGKWNGEFITFELLKWSQEGGNGHIGNQPIIANHWFTDAVKKINAMIPIVTKQFLKSKGLI